MIVLKTVTALLGLAFALFGYFIFFKKKYFLINDFKTDKRTEKYAKTVGLVEFIIGLILILFALLIIIFA